MVWLPLPPSRIPFDVQDFVVLPVATSSIAARWPVNSISTPRRASLGAIVMLSIIARGFRNGQQRFK